MERVIVWYIRMSVIYFVLGALFGVAMFLWPEETGYYVSVHVHLNLLGFMSMMIYGVGYHILPRFSGRTTYSPLFIRIQFWLANAGLLGMTISWSFVIRDSLTFLFNPVLMISAFCSLIAIVLFAVNVLKTIKSA
jgi:cbb3-type cytochrome oxidase subunit 1